MGNCDRCNAGLDLESGIFQRKDDLDLVVCPTCAFELTVLTVFNRLSG